MKSFLLTVAGITLGVASVFSQDDSSRYIFGLPVDADTVQDFPNHDFRPENDARPVPVYALPAEVRESLNEPQYEGWQDSTVYFQENTGLYLVPVKYANGIKIFGLNANGEPVTYDEVDGSR